MRLTEDTFLLYAAQHYDNPNCTSSDEFLEDLNRIKYLKKLFFTYEKKQVLRERLILNHLVVLYNVFNVRACTKMLLFKLEEYHGYLVPFLVYMGYMPEKVEYDGVVIQQSDIRMDMGIIQKLREIDKGTK